MTMKKIYLDKSSCTTTTAQGVEPRASLYSAAGLYEGFRPFRLQKGDELMLGQQRSNYIIVLMSGRGNCSFSGTDNLGRGIAGRTIELPFGTHEMLLAIASDNFSLRAEQEVQGIVFTFDSLQTNKASSPLGLDNFVGRTAAIKRCYALPLSPIMWHFWEGINMLLSSGYMSPWLEKSKKQELLYIISHNYTMADVAAFFHPFVWGENSFRNMVIDNYNPQITTDELVRLSGMCRTNFYRRFKQEFGTSVHRWMQVHRAYAVRDTAAEPGMNVKQLMNRHHFVSASNFIRFCQMYYHCNPNELVHRVASGKSMPVVNV